jgi:hypothetical protein
MRLAQRQRVGQESLRGGMLVPGTENAADPPANIARPNGYLVHILLRESATIPVARQLIRGNKWTVKLQYDSLTGRRYETRIVIDDLVLTTVSLRTEV